MRVVCLSGGVGGAKLARGLQDVLAPGELTVIGNVGDDVDVLGLHVSPDLDSVLYALAGLNDEERGWGRRGETWEALESAAAWGGESWFRLGDRDLGLHLVRTQAVRAGEPLSQVTARLTARVGVATHLIPATDDRLRTHVVTPAGMFSFQEWFVGRGHRDEVDDVVYEGAAAARPAPDVLEALRAADAIVIAPSNPYVSIGPILAVGAIRDAVAARDVVCVAVSPLVGGRAVRGPLDRMLSRMAGGTTPAHVTDRYKGLIDALVIDRADAPGTVPFGDTSVPSGSGTVPFGDSPHPRLVVADTLMTDRAAAGRLAMVVLEAAS
jgi:LPPG:FO 2-phospho-L-lactate transferase